MVLTRWNSEYEMLERMVTLPQPLSDVLSISTKVMSLSELEWKRIIDVINILQPLYQMTTFACGVKYPTIGMIQPIICGIQDALRNLDCHV